MILEVALPIPVPKTFDYRSLENHPADHSLIGRRVRVLFGARPVTGVVVGEKDYSNAPASKLKKILAVIDEDPILNSHMLDLGRWLSQRYVCSLGEALFVLLPPRKDKAERRAPAPRDVYFHDDSSSSASPHFELTDDQKATTRKIHAAIYASPHTPGVFLLRGVAAAGKTEVYLAAIKDAMDQGKTALTIVPEIGLAIQLDEVVRKRFGDKNVCLWHSGVPLRQRLENWERIRRAEFLIVVGARSAALLPLPDLGVIIVDEEHESAYKEDRKPRFRVRDLALQRAKQSDAVVIFGSATPSLELFQKTKDGEVDLVELDERAVRASAPYIRIVDMKREKTKGALSSPLLASIDECLKKHEQAILFLNRRGFHRFIRCPSCDWVARCPQCGVTLVEHKGRIVIPAKAGIQSSNLFLMKVGNLDSRFRGNDGQQTNLVCHYCSQLFPLPSACPDCGHKKLFAGGSGTERVEDEIKEKLPWAHVARWDRDSVKGGGAQEKIFKEFRNGKIDVLVGTQVVAQGFNFPKVTLVGVVDADVPLHIPHFRAAEHTFQMITQVAGRAGRELVTGEVLVQTRQPDHFALAFAAQMDYNGFAEAELKFRQELHYPPFSHLVQVQTTSKDAGKAEKDSENLAAWAFGLSIGEPIGILGPTKSRRTKKGAARWQVLLKVPKSVFDIFLGKMNEFFRENYNRFSVDVDPI